MTARKGTGQITPSKGSSGQRSSQIRSTIVPQSQRRGKKTVFTRRGEELQTSRRSTRSQDTRINLLHTAADMRRAEGRGEKLTLSRAARARGVDPRSRHTHVTELFYKDSSGRIHARKSDRYTQKFTLPTTRPDVLDSITARGSEERSLVGRWLNGIKAAGEGNFDLIRDFPKGTFVDGKRLPTSAFEVQKILEAMEQSETAIEQKYFAGGAR
jgi:hypothetical protein